MHHERPARRQPENPLGEKTLAPRHNNLRPQLPQKLLLGLLTIPGLAVAKIFVDPVGAGYAAANRRSVSAPTPDPSHAVATRL